ncbi:hypothetical protein [Planctomonas psychrotolerans]|uniref:hypothetical protein n=1 Tax=Planctomonas psychrotolerans TaxID=2528712 RepID=UPI00123AF8F4|nr:hypothetical protein [Planctomonas psychrotolerans]
MKPLRYDESLLPLTTDARVEDRVGALIGRASRRQIWYLFVAESGVQLPLLMPIRDHPASPSPDDPARFAAVLAHVAEATDARQVIVVLERYGGRDLTPSDLAWASTLHRAADLSPLSLRAVLLSHAHGVRWVAQDDYGFPAGS